jgi:hypothetical protein
MTSQDWYERNRSFRYLVFASVRSGNDAKLSSVGLWLNASKPESVLETMMLVPHMNTGVQIRPFGL